MMIFIGFSIGFCFALFFVLVYIKFFRNKRILSSLFDLNSYNTQQLSILLGDRILSKLKEKSKVVSINQELLPLKFQSQWCEDIILYKYFKNKKSGFYIEIGAFDGVKLSNSYFFECIGWTGILVEPQPEQFEKCKVNRPNSQCINAAVSMLTGDVELTIVDNEHYKTWSFVGDADNNVKNLGFALKKIKVPCVNISDILLENNNKIDFISIDVEGMEMEILKTIDLSNNGPEIILLENDSEPIRKYLSMFGYKLVYKTWINFFYSKNEMAFNDFTVWEDIDIEILG